MNVLSVFMIPFLPFIFIVYLCGGFRSKDGLSLLGGLGKMFDYAWGLVLSIAIGLIFYTSLALYFIFK